MRLDLSEEQEILRSALADLLSAESGPERVRAAEETGFDPALWKHLLQMGVVGVRVPEALGGAGGSLLDAVLVAEQFGRAVAPVPLVEAICVAGLLAQLESDGARLALTEVLSGHSVPALALRDTAESAVQLVPGGAAANIVLALDGEALVLLRRARGEVDPAPRSLGSSAIGRWHLDATPPGGARVVLTRGDEARDAFYAAVEQWHLLTASALTGLAGRALEIGVEYAKTRMQFGRPIGAFQAIAHPFADAATTISAARLMVQYAVWSVATSKREASARVCFAFAAAAEAAQAASEHALHSHGGYGVSLEYDIQLYFRRARAWALAGGSPRDKLVEASRRLWDDAAAPVPLPDAGHCELDFSFDAETERFREVVRAFFDRELPHETRSKVDLGFEGFDPSFQKKLAAEGLLFPQWPVEFGGRAASSLEMTVLWEEYDRAGWSAHAAMTTGMVGATLIEFASEQLKREVLPRILSGEAIISLGYTEPGSGSDVAAAQTRAEPDGDHWRITGQKMFTSGAEIAQYVFLLTRTDPEATKRQRGLTMFLVPLDAAGVEIHPVHTLSDERTNVTYYNDVRIPDRYRVGGVNEGWAVVGHALAIEHGSGLTSGGHHLRLSDLGRKVDAWVRDALREGSPVLADPRAGETFARVVMHAEMAFLLGRRALWCSTAGQPQLGIGPMNKLFSSEMLLADASALLEIMAPGSLLREGEDGAVANGAAEFAYRLAAANTIYGGTSEIMRSQIARQALGLPVGA